MADTRNDLNKVLIDHTAGLMVYRVGGDGKLEFARKYDVDTAKRQKFRSRMVTLGSGRSRNVVAAAGIEPALRFPRSRF